MPSGNLDDSIGKMAGEVRDKNGDDGGNIKRLAAKAKTKRKMRQQRKDAQSGNISQNHIISLFTCGVSRVGIGADNFIINF